MNTNDSVNFLDIDGSGSGNMRYWKDVYLIVGWKDVLYPRLGVGDEVLALVQNDDLKFTTVYYRATIRASPDDGQQLVLHFIDEPMDKNIKIMRVQTTRIRSVNGIVIEAPTVIRRVCAEHTSPHKTAIDEYRKCRAKKEQSSQSNPRKRNFDEMAPNEATSDEPPSKRLKSKKGKTGKRRIRLRVSRRSKTDKVPVVSVPSQPIKTQKMSNVEHFF